MPHNDDNGGTGAASIVKAAVAPGIAAVGAAVGRYNDIPWEVIIPWTLLLVMIAVVVMAWLDGTIIHKREYGRLIAELEKWQQIVAQLNPALGMAVGLVKRASDQVGDVNIDVNIKSPHEEG